MRRTDRRPSWRLAALPLLLTAAPALAGAAEPPTWVFFADRGQDDAGLATALADRGAELDPRALARRRRVRGDAGVDVRDLPPPPTYVAEVLATGARLRTRSRWLNAISVEADADQRAAIASLPAVAGLRPVGRRPDPPPALRSAATPARAAAPRPTADDDLDGVAREQLELLNLPLLHACGLTGAGVVVAVQDSGFSREHAALRGLDVVAARDFVNDDDEVADQPGDPKGQDNHGTMVLGLLAGDDPGRYRGAAPGVSLILSKTEDSSVEAPFEEDRFVAGLEWSEAMGADLFTSSLGYVDWYAPAQLDGHTAVSSRAAATAVEQGLIVLVSVGNAGPGPGSLLAPGDADGVIAVGAVDPDGAVAEFSSRGPTADGRIKPDIAAPGQHVWVVAPNSSDSYAKGDGTSLAAPLAAGAAALLLEAFPELDPAGMRELLRASSSRADAPDNQLGWGLLDAAAPFAGACACADEDGDGATAAICGGDDCDDADPALHPDADETCDDGRDNDCDALVDADDPACAAGTDSGAPQTGGDDDSGPADPGGDDDTADSAEAVDEPAGSTDAGCGCRSPDAGWAALWLPWLLLTRRRR